MSIPAMPSDDPFPALQPSPLLAAGRLLAERGVYSLVWFGKDLIVDARYGRLASSIEVGDYLPDRCIALFGLENAIVGIAEEPHRILEIPAIAVVTAEGDEPRLNLTIFWDGNAQSFLMLAGRAATRSDIEDELSKQMRARLIAESEVAAKTREIARANRDLEDFAAVISHDLKAPLRALRYAAEDMTSALKIGDTTAVHARLSEIQARTRRMSDMMTALLDYAAAGRKTDVAETTETVDVVTEVVRSMPLPPGFEVTIDGEWPRTEIVRAALDLVLRNLIDNAIKHHDRSNGLIQITCAPTTDALHITVADDGPGIPAALHKAVLLPFRVVAQAAAGQPASQDKNQGTGLSSTGLSSKGQSSKGQSTGMGLAFVNRAIETVGGTLAIVSDPPARRGTTFILTWPIVIRG